MKRQYGAGWGITRRNFCGAVTASTQPYMEQQEPGGECFLVEAETGKVIELPDMDTVTAQLDAAAQPADNRPDSNFKTVEWVDNTTVRVDYYWTTQGYKLVSGTYEYDIASGVCRH